MACSGSVSTALLKKITMNDEDFKCDNCKEIFTLFEVKIFSEEEKCSPFTELHTLCNECYEKITVNET